MRFSLNISQRGLILVAVPLISGLVFVSVLVMLLSQAEAETARQVQVKMVIFQAATLSRLFNDAGVAMAGYNLTRDELFKSPSDEILTRIRNEFRKMDRTAASNGELTAAVTKMKSDSQPVLDDLSKASVDISAGRNVDIAGLTAELKSLAKKLTSELNRLTAEDEKLESPGADRSLQWRRMIQTFLGVGVLLNIAMTLLLAGFFSNGITSRLRVLTDNAGRFGRHEPLHKSLSGTDEIAQLDHVFHRMVASINEAEKRKQEFISIVSHDLKTPLTSLQMFLSMLGEGFYGELNAKGQKNVESCDRSINRLLNLIRDLLDIERLSSGNLDLDLRPVAISSVIERSVEAVQHFAAEHRVTIIPPTNDARTLADEDRLVQVLVNLLSNAVKFSVPDSNVTISIIENLPWLEVRVTDTGRGVPENMKDAIFERFKQVEASDAKEKKGTGLGLPICKAIIEQHQGTIGVDSTPGFGSTFWFRLKSMEQAEATVISQPCQEPPV